MNKVFLVGRLTRDPELKYSPAGVPVCYMNIAVYRNKENTDFVNVVAFRQIAENAHQHLGKGRQVAIEGSLHSSKYEKDGKKIYKQDVVVERILFLGGSKDQKTEETGFWNEEGEMDAPF